MTDILAPTKFVGLHSHSTNGSVYDAIGTPQDHINFVLKNGGQALALTDHGNMNGFSHQYLYVQDLIKKGIKFKAIHGNEAYFVPSLKDWKILYDQTRETALLAKQTKKIKNNTEIGNELFETEEELKELSLDHPQADVKDEEETGGTIIENEEETKTNKYKNPLKQRSHLVLIAKNSTGLRSLFRITSDSSIEGYYGGYPRCDYEMLRKHAKGNIIALSACLGGRMSKIVFDHQLQPNHELWVPNNDNFEHIQELLAQEILLFQEALGKENYFLELQWNKLGAQHLVNYHLIEASKRTGAALLVTCDAHYSDPSHWKEREIYKLMNPMFHKQAEENMKKVPQKIEELKCELYPKNAQQVWDSYKQYGKNVYPEIYDDLLIKEAIERTHEIAFNMIDQDVHPDRKVKLPEISKIVVSNELERLKKEVGAELDEDTLAFKELKKLAIEGLLFRKVQEKQEYIDRLKHELDVVKTLKFSKYFLLYHQIIKICEPHMLWGNARGSGGGSLLCYLLKITQVDPIRFGLLFERFLVKNKKGYPDVDSDISDRDKAVKLLQEHFGEENVVPVSNFAMLKPLSLLKDLSKLYGFPFEDVNRYTVNMIPEVMSHLKAEAGFDAQLYELNFEDLAKYSISFQKFMEYAERVPEFKENLNVLFKQQKSLGKHAGGIILTDSSRDNMPLIKAKGGIQTPWPEGLAARHLEAFGMLKFDILGLSTLAIFEETIRRILKKKTGKKYIQQVEINDWFYQSLHPDNNQFDDMNVYKYVYWQGNFCNIFQFVKPNVQRFMQKMKPTSILDIAIATSIHRPGPLGIEADKLYLNNRNNPSEIEYEYPLLQEVLDSTGGLIIFQEQLQLIYNTLGGVPLEETDAIRKALTKKDLSNKDKQELELQRLRGEFIRLSGKENNIPEEKSSKIFDEMMKFVSYSFNKSHAVAYAITSYQCAYFLTYHQHEWIAAYLDYASNQGGGTKTIALMEVASLGHKLEKPDINLSEEEYTVHVANGKTIFIPSFAAIKGVGKTALYEIKQFRPYKSVEELLFNSDGSWRHSKFNKRALSHLIKTRSFNSMGIIGTTNECTFNNYKQMHTVLIDGYDELKKIASRKKNNDARGLLRLKIDEVKREHPEDWTIKEKQEFMIELSGNTDWSLVIPPSIEEYLTKTKIDSVDMWENPDDVYWFIVSGYEILTSSKGTVYVKLGIQGASGSKRTCRVWLNRNDLENIPTYAKNSIGVGKFQKDDWGFSTKSEKLRVLLDKSIINNKQEKAMENID